MSGSGGGDDTARDSRGSAVRCVRALPATISERVGRGGTGGFTRCPDHRRRARLRFSATGRRMGNHARLTLQSHIHLRLVYAWGICLFYAWGFCPCFVHGAWFGLCVGICLVYPCGFIWFMHDVVVVVVVVSCSSLEFL